MRRAPHLPAVGHPAVFGTSELITPVPYLYTYERLDALIVDRDKVVESSAYHILGYCGSPIVAVGYAV